MTRSVIAFVVVVASLGPMHSLTASAATPCRAQRIGAIPAWQRGTCLTPQPAVPALTRSGYAELDLLSRMNDERAARGIAPLRYDARLTTFARGWSKTMSTSGFRHSDIRRLFEGRLNYVGENIAWASGPNATSGAIHTMWMQSSGHRENMLAPAFDVVGVGVYCAPDGTLWATQDFGRSAALGSSPPITVPAANPLVRSDRGTITC